MGGRCSPDIQGKQGVRKHKQIRSFGVCAGTYLMRLWHSLELLPVSMEPVSPSLTKMTRFMAKGRKKGLGEEKREKWMVPMGSETHLAEGHMQP